MAAKKKKGDGVCRITDKAILQISFGIVILKWRPVETERKRLRLPSSEKPGLHK